jgi:hypothetical protein
MLFFRYQLQIRLQSKIGFLSKNPFVGQFVGHLPKKQKGLNRLKPLVLLVWALLESNQPPSDYESDALTE